MPIILNLAQNGILAQSDILRIQESARQQTRDCMTIGHRQFVVQHIPFLNCFLVDYIPSGLLASLRRHQTANSMSNSLERQLNDGRTAVELFREHLINERNILMQQELPEKSLQNKVLSSAFIVDPEDKLIPHYALCCPVTLEIPVNGVFGFAPIFPDTCYHLSQRTMRIPFLIVLERLRKVLGHDTVILPT
ncbi:hypothetical protein DNX02_21710 [Escherichia coli]|nr:DUF1076 domain-containing protein [Escherichia coli]EFJ3987555.1 DUF1076 domain-containing protein [Escherichia coli]EGD9484972.1 hypothetical protein [Escherichia coli]EKH0192572.1 T3SS effector NleG family protein [Escherichia coli]MDA6795329.1 T3SS effector NleG family protein [Escherichia coli]